MTSIKFEICRCSENCEPILVEGDRALIGSASHCDVRLPIDQAAPEQAWIIAEGITLRIEAKVSEPQTRVDGTPCCSRVIDSGSVISINATRLVVTLMTADSQRTTADGARGRVTLLLRLLGLAACLAVGVVLLQDKGAGAPVEPNQPPSLFTDAPPTCPHENQQEALAYAAEEVELANGKRERMPFVAQEGVAAAALYRVAAACFVQVGASERSREAIEAAQTIEHELTDDFRARSLRLSRMLGTGDYELAQRDIGVMLALVKDSHGPTLDWLLGLAKQLKAQRTQ